MEGEKRVPRDKERRSKRFEEIFFFLNLLVIFFSKKKKKKKNLQRISPIYPDKAKRTKFSRK